MPELKQCVACANWGTNFHRHHLDGRLVSEAKTTLCPECHRRLHMAADKMMARPDTALVRLLVRFVAAQVSEAPERGDLLGWMFAGRLS